MLHLLWYDNMQPQQAGKPARTTVFLLLLYLLWCMMMQLRQQISPRSHKLVLSLVLWLQGLLQPCRWLLLALSSTLPLLKLPLLCIGLLATMLRKQEWLCEGFELWLVHLVLLMQGAHLLQ